ncbi:MAG: sulfite oxidase [Arenicellaceae bacterium]|nr:sulfite oxidase [Arenicellaceae bacterium]
MKVDKQKITDAYAEHGELADELIFGRRTHKDRRGFLRGAGLAAMGALVGGFIPFHRNMPAGLIPAALAQSEGIAGKDGLIQLSDRPLNAETSVHMLDDNITPTNRHFIRNNGSAPASVDADNWTLTVDGLVDQAMTFSIEDLKSQFEVVTKALVIECGGNGRAFFYPPALGNQWTFGAVACSEWTGVRLKDVLLAAGVGDGVIYTAHEGADIHLSGDTIKSPLSRGMPIDKAMDDDNLIAFAQNGEALHLMNGAPLRLVVPGWPGSLSQKWLTRIWLRDQVHDGAKMTGTSYRVPNRPVAPGEEVATEDFEIIHEMPVKSLITTPANRISHLQGDALQVRGHAWAGDIEVSAVAVSIDFGATWQSAELDAPVNSHAWQNWRVAVEFPEVGYYEVWARATDSNGISQPHAIPWNPKGYLNNALHRIAVNVA